jgi:hypothetical protein
MYLQPHFYIADDEDCAEWGIDWGFSLQLGIISISFCSGPTT